MAYLLLVCAIIAEVVGTLSLRVAAAGKPIFYVAVAAGHAAAFSALLVSLRHGMPLGVAYGIWAASGVALTTLASRVLFGEPLTRRMLAGVGLIVVGVLLVEIGAAH